MCQVHPLSTSTKPTLRCPFCKCLLRRAELRRALVASMARAEEASGAEKLPGGECADGGEGADCGGGVTFTLRRLCRVTPSAKASRETRIKDRRCGMDGVPLLTTAADRC
eukprot:5991912-Pleurochrysis_carterae.AAC.1